MRAILVFISMIAMAGSATAQGTSKCADCHIANNAAPTLAGFAGTHLDAWDRSPHARHNVGCEKCHGGDATTFERGRAHLGLLHSTNPASPVSRTNLPRTCGGCHTGPFVAFQKSRHYELLIGGDKGGPTCSTCHGEVAAHLFSPSSIASRCDSCHGAGKAHERPDHGSDAGILLRETRTIREYLDQSKALIRRVKDEKRRAALEEQWHQAEVPLIEARQAGHQFVFDNMRERLATARQRSERLLEVLVNRVEAAR